MSEKILKIEERVFSTKETMVSGREWESHYDGFVVTTDEQEIMLGVSSGQSCCESWGYFMSHDNLTDFIGASVVGVSVVGTALNVEKIESEGAGDYSRDKGDIMFVNIETDRGVLQFCAYNCHNGYYGHTGIVQCKQVTETAGL